jgi:hypothetical protein
VAWSKSAIFRGWLECALRPTAFFNGGWNLPPASNITRGDFRCSLWNDTVTPDEAAPIALTGYNGYLNQGEWRPAGREVTNPPNWSNGGTAMTGHGTDGGFTSAGGLITFGADNTVSAGPVTMTDIFGDMVFHGGQAQGPLNNPAGYQGLCFHYYGGLCEVDAGTFTVVWPPERVAQIQFV